MNKIDRYNNNNNNLNSSEKEDKTDNSDNSDTDNVDEDITDEDITDEKENILLGIFLENILRKLNTNSITTREKTEMYRFILNFNNVKNIESNEYLQNKNMLKYYILGWYVSSNLVDSDNSSTSTYSESDSE